MAILVVADEPQGYPYYGGTVAAPILKRVMEDGLRYLGVPRQFSEKEGSKTEDEKKKEVLVPDVISLPLDKASHAIRAVGLTPKVAGEGHTVIEQIPAADTRIITGSQVLLKLSEGISNDSEVTVPDVTGKRVPRAATLLEAMGLVLKPQGAGTAVEQRPVPGTKVSPGTEIYVIFKEVPEQTTTAP